MMNISLIYDWSDAKAMEAASSGYYNPANPHNVYTPAPYPTAPPAYDDINKKNQWHSTFICSL